MTTSVPSLLPPNATPLVRAFEQGTARVGAITSPVVDLWDPETCPLSLLPWLAWGLSVDQWDAGWSEATKRAAVAASIALHRRKGTPAAVEAVLARFDALLELVEWWEADLAPHNFEIRLPLGAAGGARATAAFAEAIIRDVTRVKPVREHFRLVQSVALAARVGVQTVARVALFTRTVVALASDTDPAWTGYLQTEDGEPLETDNGDFLEDTP